MKHKDDSNNNSMML